MKNGFWMIRDRPPTESVWPFEDVQRGCRATASSPSVRWGLTIVGASGLTLVGAILLSLVGAIVLTRVGAIPLSFVGAIALTRVGTTVLILAGTCLLRASLSAPVWRAAQVCDETTEAGEKSFEELSNQRQIFGVGISLLFRPAHRILNFV
jgi:hypothetical protein